MIEHTTYMQRAIELAKLGTKAVKSNPKVGSVLVHKNRIIGEGYHMKYGESHAEVNCIESVRKEDQHLIAQSRIYVTLEPCHHQGKTPPCVDLIIKHNIKEVIIGITDPNPKVSGQSIAKLRSIGVSVVEGICKEECHNLIHPFIKLMNQKLPWIHLKFAKSKFNYMAAKEGQVWLSTPQSKLHVHTLRSDVDAIMIGTNTAKEDDPSLTTRLVDGDHPLRIVLDRKGELSSDLNVLSDGHPTIYVTDRVRTLPSFVKLLIHDFDHENHLEKLLSNLFNLKILSIIVEGGSTLLKSFNNFNLWDEATVIDTQHELNSGMKAPNLNGILVTRTYCDSDVIDNFRINNYTS